MLAALKDNSLMLMLLAMLMLEGCALTLIPAVSYSNKVYFNRFRRVTAHITNGIKSSLR